MIEAAEPAPAKRGPYKIVTSRMTRRFQTVAFWALFALTVAIAGLTPILLLGWVIVGLSDEQFATLPLFWQLWPGLLIFLILGVLWWALITWMRRTDRRISN